MIPEAKTYVVTWDSSLKDCSTARKFYEHVWGMEDQVDRVVEIDAVTNQIRDIARRNDKE